VFVYIYGRIERGGWGKGGEGGGEKGGGDIFYDGDNSGGEANNTSALRYLNPTV